MSIHHPDRTEGVYAGDRNADFVNASSVLFPKPPINGLDGIMQRCLREHIMKMLNGNHDFLCRRIHEIEHHAQAGDTERSKLNLMARFWFHKQKWPRARTDWFSTNIRVHNITEQLRREEAVTRLEEVKTLYHPHMSGLMPQAFFSDHMIVLALNTIEEMARDLVWTGASQELPVPPLPLIPWKIPQDIYNFHRYAGGICDPDFRDEGMCTWTLFDGIDISEVNNDDAAFKQAVLSHLNGIHVDECPMNVDKRVEVALIFLTSQSWAQHQDTKWESYYALCRPRDPVTGTGMGLWRWRIIFDAFCEFPDKEPGEVLAFDNVISVLQWYSAWIGSPVTEHLVSQVYSQEFEPESDSEDEPDVLQGMILH